MIDHYNTIQELTAQVWAGADQQRRVNDFAYDLGWRPSDRLELPSASEFATGHLVVEHGLQNTAVISFLKTPWRFPQLSMFQQKVLVNASYNSLVDWHINIDQDGVSFVYNRFAPPEFYVVRHPISREKFSRLKSAEFEKVAERHPTPNVPALDDALISTISLWKRQLASEIPDLSNHSLSALFNAIIFARAVEDQARRKRPALAGENERSRQLLTDTAGEQRKLPIRQLLRIAFEQLKIQQPPPSVVELDALRVFDNLDGSWVSELLSDFYRNKYEKYYEYDFSLMSKHALSRIYEHYVSILRVTDTPQKSLFPSLPEEKIERSYGNIYTPEFIARFFAKYLRKQLPLASFQKIRVVDPACGSGLFLRTVLELQHESLFDDLTTESLNKMFANVIGVDVDPNACHAARLSLSLLALVLIDKFPDTLEIINANSIQYFPENRKWLGMLDAVIANPPFVTIEDQSKEIKDRVSQLMGHLAKGRIDLYLAILKIALDLLKPGGFGLFVLPHNFLIAESARGMRDFLKQQAWILCLADLSAVRVFDDVGVYVVLLIFQKKIDHSQPAPNAVVMRCHDLVGRALQDVLDARPYESAFYAVYEVSQIEFAQEQWLIQPPATSGIQRKFQTFSEITNFVEIRQGVISGADDVFIVDRHDIPPGEESIFIPFLPDREMEAYTVPRRIPFYIFFPYIGDQPLDEKTLKREFRGTWRFLSERRKSLENRKPVRSKELPWWRPTRPREPGNLLRPKIITPHLVVVPKFALDARGRLAVSHSPMISARPHAGDNNLLKYLLAVLNSSACFWHISQGSHSYSRGYARLEVSTLSKTRVPDPSHVERGLMRKLVRLIDERLEIRGQRAFEIETEIDEIVADIYGLSKNERVLAGMKSKADDL